MVQFDGFHISVKASTSRLLSIIRSIMSKAFLQTERAFYNPMVIFAAASIGVNSAEKIWHDLDLGRHIVYCVLEPASPGTGHPLRKYAMAYGLQMTWFGSWLEMGNETLHDCQPEKGQGALRMALSGANGWFQNIPKTWCLRDRIDSFKFQHSTIRFTPTPPTPPTPHPTHPHEKLPWVVPCTNNKTTWRVPAISAETLTLEGSQ